jgi:hypothetical protein
MMRFKTAAVVALLACTGCVERMLTIQSDPPGAVVYLNQQEVGRTPLETRFTWYGNYDVMLRKDGYETLKTNGQVHPPAWQWPVIDLLFDVIPARFEDRHTLNYTLKPTPDTTGTDLIARGERMREQLEASPTTRPAR